MMRTREFHWIVDLSAIARPPRAGSVTGIVYDVQKVGCWISLRVKTQASYASRVSGPSWRSAAVTCRAAAPCRSP